MIFPRKCFIITVLDGWQGAIGLILGVVDGLSFQVVTSCGQLMLLCVVLGTLVRSYDIDDGFSLSMIIIQYRWGLLGSIRLTSRVRVEKEGRVDAGELRGAKGLML